MLRHTLYSGISRTGCRHVGLQAGYHNDLAASSRVLRDTVWSLFSPQETPPKEPLRRRSESLRDLPVSPRGIWCIFGHRKPIGSPDAGLYRSHFIAMIRRAKFAPTARREHAGTTSNTEICKAAGISPSRRKQDEKCSPACESVLGAHPSITSSKFAAGCDCKHVIHIRPRRNIAG